MEFIEQIKDPLLIILGALLATLGGFLQKRFDLKIDTKNRDVIILTEIDKLLLESLTEYLSSKEINEKQIAILKSKKEIQKTAFQIRSAEFRKLRQQILDFLKKDKNLIAETKELQKLIEAEVLKI